MNVPEDVFPLALLYLRIYLLGMPVILLYNFEAAIFRSMGETRTPLLALTASGILNVILNLFFVAVLHMTVNGVAIATVLSNAVSSVILYRRLRLSTLDIHLDPKRLRIDRESLRPDSAHRPARRHSERRIRRFQYRDTVRHQQPGHGGHGGLQRGV